MSVQVQKAELRTLLRAQLSRITAVQQEGLRQQLKSWLSHETGTWGCFWPLAGEPDLRPLWSEIEHLTWVFPRCQGEELQFHRANGHWVKGAFGVNEPDPQSERVERSRIQGVLIPGLGFDRTGLRIGRGKGFYDRFLSGWHGIRVGVCFENQWVDRIPKEAHDERMDVVLTEAGPWKVPKEG